MNTIIITKKIKLIDIHTHLIPGVDDGVENYKESIEILNKMINDGVTDVICTPHFQSVVTKSDTQTMEEKFNILKEKVENLNLNINLHFGYEVKYCSHLKPKYENYTLLGGKYLLIEFNTRNEPKIFDVIYDLKAKGLTPIIAHVERYPYLKYESILKLKKLGALIQVNSSSITDSKGWFFSKRLINRMIKEEIIDIIASDVHGIEYRYHSIRLAYDYLIKNKVNKKYVEKICYYNQLEIINK